MATQALTATQSDNDIARQKQVTIAREDGSWTLPVLLTESLRPQKFTIENQAKVLAFLAEQFNKTQAAASIGASKQALAYHVENNPQFAEAMNQVFESHMDKVEEVGLTVACLPSRDGFNDRKLFLQAYRRERFGPTLDVNSKNVNINVETSATEIRSILGHFGGGK